MAVYGWMLPVIRVGRPVGLAVVDGAPAGAFEIIELAAAERPEKPCQADEA
jgi:hypothetical protein